MEKVCSSGCPEGGKNHRSPLRRYSRDLLRLFLILASISAVLSSSRAGAQGLNTANHPGTPHQIYGPLYEAVQRAHVYPDDKTFADAVAKAEPSLILQHYRVEAPVGADALRAFVERHFVLPHSVESTLRQHIAVLWPTLTRPPLTAPDWSSAISLPEPYVVPGGRFREIYYWDTYFTMLGLKADGHTELLQAMVTNFESLLERFGFIPNGTRTYYLSRSQPPFFAAMVQLTPIASSKAEARKLAALRTEHRFWMAGEKCLPRRGAGACANVVRLSDDTILNRYWDAMDVPRDEAFDRDLTTAAGSPRNAPDVYRDLRAAAESGWDFSSRWLDDPAHLSSIKTTTIVPIDLNSLLWLLEREIARRCDLAKDSDCVKTFIRRADTRKAGLFRYLWLPSERRFADFDTRVGKPTRVLSAATLYPLWVGLATPEQAAAVAETTRTELLAEGGLRTTQLRTGEQWDAPNGWAPLQWIAIDGLVRYQQDALAKEIARRWILTVNRTWKETGRLLEKYDVEEQKPGGGGEYPTQDGFGWTNGVTSALLDRYPDLTP